MSGRASPPTPLRLRRWAAPSSPDDVDKWLAFWGAARPRELTTPTVSNGREPIPAAHGSFDNDRDTITRTLTRILGREPKVAVSDLHGF